MGEERGGVGWWGLGVSTGRVGTDTPRRVPTAAMPFFKNRQAYPPHRLPGLSSFFIIKIKTYAIFKWAF